MTGIWSRTVKARGMELELEFFARRRRGSMASFDAVCERYARFLVLRLLKRALV